MIWAGFYPVKMVLAHENVVIKNDGLAPMRELINLRRSGLISPFLWLSRAGYLGFFIGMLH
jgi:hypothetical protein